jgi:hypothetical protein
MNIFFLSLFICAVAVPIAKAPVPEAKPSIVKMDTDPSVHLSMLEKFKKDPKGFVAQMSDADPDTLRTILGLLNDLLTTSNDRETHLSGNLDTAESELDAANGAVIAAEGVLSGAEQDQTDANVAVAAATGDLADKRDAQGVAQTQKNDAQESYDDAIGSLDDEQEVLKKVIAILTELLGKQPEVFVKELTAYWDRGICGPFGEDNNWNLCGQSNFAHGNGQVGCQDNISVDTSVCSSGSASRAYTKGNGVDGSYVDSNGCGYWYFTVYHCT